MTDTPPIPWLLAGYADEVALATAGGRLWIAASTATLATEEVWLGEVSTAGVVGATRIADEPCCRPAITALVDGGALALACTPASRIVGAYLGPSGAVHRWCLETDGVPLHVATTSANGVTWVAFELARAGGRRIVVSAIDPATGIGRDRVEVGDGTRWCRWPALLADDRGAILAWCDGPARAPGTVKLARCANPLVAHEVSRSPGEAPAITMLPDDRVAIAWHRGGPSATGDERETSVVRAIEVAIVELASGAQIVTSPPAGAGGTDPRGEDQGWELPAIAGDATGAIWLVGRSTHGHHVARRTPEGTWSAPASLCNGEWGGRGRRHALVVHAGTVWLARRAPRGIEIGPCPPPAAGRADPAPRPVPAVRHVAPITEGVRFGDLHQHTAHSDGCGSFEDLWIAARDRRGLDFAAITDHDQFCRRALGPATWQLANQIAAELDEPGRFVALAAYEFTGPRYPGPGHKCVYFGSRVPDRVPGRDLDALFALLRELGGIAVPHHVGWTGGDFARHDPVVQPVWELCSVHGCYEADGACGAHPPRGDLIIPGQFVRDALDAGLRFGFIGSTDSHGLDWHHGIARWRNPFRAGLACLVDAEPTRDGIIAAMRARRSYATTGARIGLRVELDGAVMGSELTSSAHGELLVEVAPTAPVTRIAMVGARGEQELAISTIGTRARARARVPVTADAAYLYVRIEQADGEAAWSSPFWLSTTPSA